MGWTTGETWPWPSWTISRRFHQHDDQADGGYRVVVALEDEKGCEFMGRFSTDWSY